MDNILFIGQAVKGCGRYSKELVIPGKNDCPIDIPNWPNSFYPGSFNIRILQNNFPAKYIDIFGNSSLRLLDKGLFTPLAVLPSDSIQNNTLKPLPEFPDRGKAQVWHCQLRVTKSDYIHNSWVLRRIGSGLFDVFECVDEISLRNTLNVNDGDEIELELYGTWINKD